MFDLDNDGRTDFTMLFMTANGAVYAHRRFKTRGRVVPYEFDLVGTGFHPPVTAGHLRDALVARLGQV